MARPKGALEFVQVDIGFSGHPNMKKFCRKLEIGVVEGTGHVTLLLQWVGQFSPYGELSEYDDEVIADAAQWTGDPSDFWKALLYAGYVDESADGRHFHNWMDRYASLLEKREKDAARQRKSRGSNGDVTVTSDDSPRLSEVKDSRGEESEVEDGQRLRKPQI